MKLFLKPSLWVQPNFDLIKEKISNIDDKIEQKVNTSYRSYINNRTYDKRRFSRSRDKPGFITNNSYLGSKISNDETAIKTEDNTLNKEFGFLIKNKLKKIMIVHFKHIL